MTAPITKTVYQTDPAGLLVGPTEADPSPLEPGVWLMPAGAVSAAPPTEWPATHWPRWNGHEWGLVVRPTAAPRPLTPAEKLAAFLQSHPDVRSLIG